MRLFFLLGMGESCPGAQQNTLLGFRDSIHPGTDWWVKDPCYLVWLKHLIILCWSNCLTHDFNFSLAPTKLVLLSDRITCAFPRLDMNLRRVNINASVDKSLANSIWTALVIRHVNSTPYLFAVPEFDLVLLFILTWYGPKYTIPVLRNGLSPMLSLSFGTSPIRLF